MRLPLRLAMLSAAATLLLVTSCAQESPTRVGRPPVVQGFSPSDQSFAAFIGDTLLFTIQAFDPDDDRLESWFLLADSVVGSGPTWSYVVEDTGDVLIVAVVSDDTYSARIGWLVTRHDPVNLPPVITNFLPIELNPTMIIGTTLEFSVVAVDPEAKTVSVFFLVDDVTVAQDKQFQYTATEFGPHLVRAVASDGTNFTTHDWNLRVTAVPDTIPPAQVVLTRLETGTNPGDVDVEWIAVGQDGMDGIASNYLVRTSPAPVLTEEDWGRSSDRPGVPPPAPAGELMSMTITDIISGRFTYVAVRAVDDFGNLSPLSATAGVNARGMHITGVVRDAESNVPLPDVIVRVANTVSITAADGSFEFFELGPVDGDITVTEDGVVGDIGTHYDFAMPYVIVHEDYVELFLIPNFAMVSSIYTDFYLWFRAMTDTPGIPESTQQRRWELPIDLYVPDYSNGGLDFAKVIKEVAAEFDAYLGRPVFRIVGARPALGVFINYRDDITHDNWLVVEWDPDRYPAVGRIQHRTAYSDSTEEALRKVSRHEFGHALGLNHSVDNLHVMVGGSAPQAVAMSLDEIRIMRVRYNLPRGLNVVGFGPE